MRHWNAYWFGPVNEVRPFLGLHFMLGMLALDTWILMIERGARYGAGGFNVAHFSWLDQIQPTVTPSLYVGLINAVGLLAAFSTLTSKRTWITATIFVGYTYAWSMSMLDSYQHHYFLSILLACFIFFPSGWAYRLALISVAILYVYTAISKMDSEWLHGHALIQMSKARDAMDFIHSIIGEQIISRSLLLEIFGVAVVVVQLLIAIGYLLSPWLEQPRFRWISWTAFFLALSFHVSTEWLDLKIGWFSYYMILSAAIAFLPLAALTSTATLLRRFHRAVEVRVNLPRLQWLFAVPALVALTWLSTSLDLPGIPVATGMVSTALMIYALVRSNTAGSDTVSPTLICLTASTFAMWLTINLSDVRFNYYRYLGGDSLRRGDLHTALIAYKKANHYAPKGKTRTYRIEHIRDALRRRGSERLGD